MRRLLPTLLVAAGVAAALPASAPAQPGPPAISVGELAFPIKNLLECVGGPVDVHRYPTCPVNLHDDIGDYLVNCQRALSRGIEDANYLPEIGRCVGGENRRAVATGKAKARRARKR